jgi:catechol 2,3-dioxygenase-like lactoylglutathione lyase family enzyme
MIGYTLVGANDLAAARSFYDALFASVGVGLLAEFPNGGFAYGKSWEQPMFGVGKPYDGGPATFGNGTMIAIVFDSRAHIDAIHAKAMELGGKDEGAPGVRGEDGDQAFYAAYFRDPDGNKLCAFAMGPG